MNATVKAEKAAVTQAAEGATIRAMLQSLLAQETKVSEAKAAAAAVVGASQDGWKAAGKFYADKYGTLDAMSCERAEAEVKADIVAALPDAILKARAKREAGTLLTARQIAESDMDTAQRRLALAEIKLANAYMGYQTVYFDRLREYAFPTVKSDAQKFREAMLTAYKRLDKVAKAIPDGVTPQDVSEAKAALATIGKKFGITLASKATNK